MQADPVDDPILAERRKPPGVLRLWFCIYRSRHRMARVTVWLAPFRYIMVSACMFHQTDLRNWIISNFGL